MNGLHFGLVDSLLLEEVLKLLDVTSLVCFVDDFSLRAVREKLAIGRNPEHDFGEGIITVILLGSE